MNNNLAVLHLIWLLKKDGERKWVKIEERRTERHDRVVERVSTKVKIRFQHGCKQTL